MIVNQAEFTDLQWDAQQLSTRALIPHGRYQKGCNCGTEHHGEQDTSGLVRCRA